MSEPAALLKRIPEGEGVFQEFKTSLEKIDRTLVAFANTRGGVLYIGIDDHGAATGFKLSNKIKAQIQDIARNIDPPLTPTCIDLGKCAAVIVKEGGDKPYRCGDGFFLRVGASNQRLGRDEIIDLAIRVNQLRFENLTHTGFRYPKDFSTASLKQFLSQSHLNLVRQSMGTENLLISLGVAEKQNRKMLFNHAGILCFSKTPQRFMPQAKISYARYRGIDKTHVVDRAILTGTLFQQLDQVERRVNAAMPLGYQLAAENVRKELPDYPPRALQEALINALVHRDYYESGGEIMVDYYADRIEISNPGELIGHLTIAGLGRKSLRRNPVIAELFFRAGRGEKLGSGITRMNALMQEWKLKAPHYESADGFFSVTFYGPKAPAAEHQLLRLPERPRLFASERNLAPDHFAAAFYATRFNVTSRTAQKDLDVLRQAGVIERQGNGKNTSYRFK